MLGMLPNRESSSELFHQLDTSVLQVISHLKNLVFFFL